MKTFHLLLVEDDENDILFLQRAFKQAGIENPLDVVRDGQEAIDYLSATGPYAGRAGHPHPCLIILDLKLPHRTGMEVLEWMRTNPELECVPVMIHSGSSQQSDVDKAYRLGANAFVVKPGSMEERVQLAKHIKGFWLHFNEPPSICATAEISEACR